MKFSFGCATFEVPGEHPSLNVEQITENTHGPRTRKEGLVGDPDLCIVGTPRTHSITARGS